MTDFKIPAPRANVAERVYYRHAQSADRGYIVFEDGIKKIRYDRGVGGAVVPFDDDIWKLDIETRPLTRHHLATIAWHADQSLMPALGLHDKREEWRNLTDAKRIAWTEVGPGPTAHVLRRSLWAAIQVALADQAS